MFRCIKYFCFLYGTSKTLTKKELKRILAFISVKRHAARNRAMLLMTHLAGMRVGEVAALRVSDVRLEDEVVKSEIRLLPEQTKGHRARTVFLNERLQNKVDPSVKTLCRLI
ncbi:tyrosine-type recombinase/integrase [Janthinobacterium sp. LB2P70]|uniref:tyrosine-type recombinase/integrase n=1 Tax=Janthinobacterium sp. LB2P70 TaxID=3424197 RepID=UPI003F22F208